MNIINNNLDNISNGIVSIDDAIILEIIKVALKCNKNTERYNLRDDMYKSRYVASGLESSELQLEYFLKTNFGSNVKTQNQNKEYKWVMVNSRNMGEIINRFYIAPNPLNLHELVGKLTKSFVLRDVSVNFKYQLTTNMKQCDRIIVYTDSKHTSDVLETIKSVYKKNKHLFIGCERSLAWLYETDVPGVYTVPETRGVAYSNAFADVILEAKNTFNYLYGLTNSNCCINLRGKDFDKAMSYMKLIVPSIMLRKGILRSKDGSTITIYDKNVKNSYDYDTGILSHYNLDNRGFYKVMFDQSPQGKDAMLRNFYNVSLIRPQPGLQLKYQTLQERAEELDRFFYPYKYEKGNNNPQK